MDAIVEPRKVFFSYHYERDQMRAIRVRDLCLTYPEIDARGFWEIDAWIDASNQGESAINAWIDKELKGTTVTVVLIGFETYDIDYVDHAIIQSCQQGNAFLGIKIHKLEDLGGSHDLIGKNPLHKYRIGNEKNSVLSSIFHEQIWHEDDGEKNLSNWIKEAAKIVEG